MDTMERERIAALDPGREKCGFAVLTLDGSVLLQRVIETAKLEQEVRAAQQSYGFSVLVEGNGTTSREARARLKEARPAHGIEVLEDYPPAARPKNADWGATPPRGWRRRQPVTMQVPPEPVDDFVAVILASRYIESNEQKGDYHHE